MNKEDYEINDIRNLLLKFNICEKYSGYWKDDVSGVSMVYSSNLVLVLRMLEILERETNKEKILNLMNEKCISCKNQILDNYDKKLIYLIDKIFDGTKNLETIFQKSALRKVFSNELSKIILEKVEISLRNS